MSLFAGMTRPEPQHHLHARAARSATTSSTTRRTSAPTRTASRRRSQAAQNAEQVVLALGETREMSGEAESRSMLDLPGKQEELIEAIKATRQAVRGGALQRAPADAGAGAQGLPRDPRGLVRRRGGGQRRGRRALRQGQPGRQAAGELPAQRGPGADLLQPQAHRPALRHRLEVQLAPPRHPQLRPAVRVRLRPELHHVPGGEPAPELVDDERSSRAHHGPRRRDQHRPGGRRRGGAALHPGSGGEHLAARPAPARLRARHAPAGPDADGELDARARGRGLLRQPRPASGWRTGASTSTRATRRPRATTSARSS